MYIIYVCMGIQIYFFKGYCIFPFIHSHSLPENTYILFTNLFSQAQKEVEQGLRQIGNIDIERMGNTNLYYSFYNFCYNSASSLATYNTIRSGPSVSSSPGTNNILLDGTDHP